MTVRKICAIILQLMKSDLGKLLMFVWMSAMIFFVYEMWISLNYMTDLVHAYIKMVMEHVRP